MERMNDLTTKTRTMGYDNDRLKGMHEAAVEKAAGAEKETSAWKSRAALVPHSPFPPFPFDSIY